MEVHCITVMLEMKYCPNLYRLLGLKLYQVGRSFNLNLNLETSQPEASQPEATTVNISLMLKEMGAA